MYLYYDVKNIGLGMFYQWIWLFLHNLNLKPILNIEVTAHESANWSMFISER